MFFAIVFCSSHQIIFICRDLSTAAYHVVDMLWQNAVLECQVTQVYELGYTISRMYNTSTSISFHLCIHLTPDGIKVEGKRHFPLLKISLHRLRYWNDAKVVLFDGDVFQPIVRYPENGMVRIGLDIGCFCKDPFLPSASCFFRKALLPVKAKR